MGKQYTWGRDGESFVGIHDTIDDAIREAVDSGCYSLGDEVEVAIAIRPTPKVLADGVNVDYILETLTEFACDNYGEHAEDWPDMPKEAVAALERDLRATLAKHLPEPTFWSVHDPRRYEVEQKHLPAPDQESDDVE